MENGTKIRHKSVNIFRNRALGAFEGFLGDFAAGFFGVDDQGAVAVVVVCFVHGKYLR